MSFAHTEVGGDRVTTPPVPQFDAQRPSTMPYNTHNNTYAAMPPAPSPTTPKSVAFELVVDNMPQFKARLPMRVQIFPHDTTESIITTVKNFYGLYAGPGRTFGISFEDEHGHTLIARYENFHDKMNVYIRVNETTVPSSGQFGPGGYQSAAPALGLPNYHNSEHQMLPPYQAASRPDSRASNGRSNSPARGRRGGSASANQRNKKPRSGGQSRGSSTHGSFADIMSDGANGYSSGDGAPGSVSSRSRGDLGNTEISIANIVEGGRRKRAKFESSVSISSLTPEWHGITSTPSIICTLSKHIMLTIPSYRSSHSSHHHKCQPQPRIHLCRQPGAWRTREPRFFHSHTQASMPLHIRMFYSLHRTMAAVLHKAVHSLPQTMPRVTVDQTSTEALSATLQTVTTFCRLRIQPLVLACRRRIKMSRCSS